MGTGPTVSMLRGIESSQRRIYVAIALVLAAVFAIDLAIPLGVAAGVPYLAAMLLTIWTSSRSTTIVALLATGLTILGIYLSPSGGEFWPVLANRFLALFVIWITAVVIDLRKKAVNALALENKELEGCVQKRTGELTVIHNQLDTEIDERAKLEMELVETIKLRSMSLLAGGLAHDFNNFLTGMIINISMAKSLPNQDSDTIKFLEAAENAISSAEGLTQQLVAFSKGAEPELNEVMIPPILQKAVEFELRGKPISIRYEFAEELWAVRINTGLIQQVISNLVINADQAMADGGQLTMTTRNYIHKIDDTSKSMKPGNYVEVVLSDNGIGIPPDVIKFIFNPYYTTKDSGTGLGLFSCQNIIKHHGGWISATSVENEGSSFFFYLPAI